jgi:hypothetical protein
LSRKRYSFFKYFHPVITNGFPSKMAFPVNAEAENKGAAITSPATNAALIKNG